MNQISTYGYRAQHTTLVLRYCKMLVDAVNLIEITDV